MRDANRIKGILHQLETVWKLNPDLRLGQLIGNLIGNLTDIGVDTYYMEDQDLIDELRKLYEHH